MKSTKYRSKNVTIYECVTIGLLAAVSVVLLIIILFFLFKLSERIIKKVKTRKIQITNIS